MIYSDLHGKNHVPEDVLTSNCLGLLSLLPDNDLLSFFTGAENAHQQRLTLPDMRTVSTELKFWPFLRGAGIPDAILTVNSPRALPFKIIIEAKHGAAKSGWGDSDQLAIYWRAAQTLFPEHCAVVYLTHYRVLPKGDIDESIRIAGSEAKIYWLSWFDLFLWARRHLTAGGRHPSEERILKMIRDYLAEKGYRTFSEWNIPSPISVTEPYCRRYATPLWLGSPAEIYPYNRSYSSGPVTGVFHWSYTSRTAEPKSARQL